MWSLFFFLVLNSAVCFCPQLLSVRCVLPALCFQGSNSEGNKGRREGRGLQEVKRRGRMERSRDEQEEELSSRLQTLVSRSVFTCSSGVCRRVQHYDVCVCRICPAGLQPAEPGWLTLRSSRSIRICGSPGNSRFCRSADPL